MTPSAKALCERLEHGIDAQTCDECKADVGVSVRCGRGDCMDRRMSELNSAVLIRAQSEQIEKLSAALVDSEAYVCFYGLNALEAWKQRHADALRIARGQA